MEFKQKVISGLRWSAGAKILSQIVTWLITIIIIRLLSPADYGLMAMSLVFVSFLTMINELGLGAAVVQKKKWTMLLCGRYLDSYLLLISFFF